MKQLTCRHVEMPLPDLRLSEPGLSGIAFPELADSLVDLLAAHV